MQQELEMEELGLEPHPEEDEDLAVEDNHGKMILLTIYKKDLIGNISSKMIAVSPFLTMTEHVFANLIQLGYKTDKVENTTVYALQCLYA